MLGLRAIAVSCERLAGDVRGICFKLVKLQMHVRVLGARERPSFIKSPSSREARGRRECRVTASPMARLQ